MNLVYKLFKSILVCLDPMVLTISISSIDNGLSCELSEDVEAEMGISRNDATILMGSFYAFS